MFIGAAIESWRHSNPCSINVCNEERFHSFLGSIDYLTWNSWRHKHIPSTRMTSHGVVVLIFSRRYSRFRGLRVEEVSETLFRSQFVRVLCREVMLWAMSMTVLQPLDESDTERVELRVENTGLSGEVFDFWSCIKVTPMDPLWHAPLVQFRLVLSAQPRVYVLVKPIPNSYNFASIASR